MAPEPQRRLAVIDLGSNSFRLVVFAPREEGWAHELELSRPVRIGEGLAASGKLRLPGIERGLAALAEFADALQEQGIEANCVEAVATSAIRDAVNGARFLELARQRTGIRARVLTREQEAHYAYLAAVHCTGLTDGCVLDLGGGSLQLVRVAGGLAREKESWPLGAVRMTECFLPGDGPAQPEQVQALKAHVDRELASAHWLSHAGPQAVGMGGTVRSLAAALQRAAGQDGELHGFTIELQALHELTARLAALPVSERSCIPGIKPARADIALGGALVVAGAMDAAGLDGLRVSGASLREGIFFERRLAQRRRAA